MINLRIIGQNIENQINIPKTGLTEASVQTVLQIVFGLGGGIALVIITIAGLKYVFSQGDSSETTKAKNTILYALIGLVVCLMAFSIVKFVLTDI